MSGPPRLVNLALQKYRLPRHDLRLADDAIYALFRDFLHKKYRLTIDSWDADDRFIRHIYDPILIKRNVPDEVDRRLYPYPVWSVEERISRLSWCILLSE
ncbi:hypothetical protein AcW1_003112 [Taiwanofungus camphoratus]|nr:hypothetical protein AcV5_001695 [Antrodia cinnamomea]KAI0942496.1 hypothetical protein AcW1_003112 [Antrodia cinnamomea]